MYNHIEHMASPYSGPQFTFKSKNGDVIVPTYLFKAAWIEQSTLIMDFSEGRLKIEFENFQDASKALNDFLAEWTGLCSHI